MVERGDADGGGLDWLADLRRERDVLAKAEALGHVGAWTWSLPTDQVWWSAETFSIFGVDPATFVPSRQGFVDCVHADDRDEVLRRLDAAIAGEAPFAVEHRTIRPDGQVRLIRGGGSVMRAADGSALSMIGFVQDVTEIVALREERAAAIEALARSEELYRLLAENAWDVVWTMSVDGVITYISPAVERVRGFTPEEAAAQTLDQIHTPDSVARVQDYFARLYAAMETGEQVPIYRAEHEYYRKDGSIMLGELQVIPQVDDDGKVVQILGVTRDISERRTYEEELNRLAVTDPLTGVWNRRQGWQLLAADVAEARRYGPDLSLLMIDIDHFKQINDTHGHQVGDRVLVELCQQLSGNLRSSDVLARWGGEEFVIVMRHCALPEAQRAAEKLRALIEESSFPDVDGVTISIGVAQLLPDDDLDSWLHRADLAMYEAKAAGRNAVRVSADT